MKTLANRSTPRKAATNLFLALFVFCITAHGQQERIRAAKQVQRFTQLQIDQQIVPQLRGGMNDKEREATTGIQINVVIDERVARVRAINDGRNKIVEISTGFLSLIGTTIDANIVAVRANAPEQLAPYQARIAEFMRNKDAEWEISGPPPFYKFAGMSEAAYQSILNSGTYWPEFERNIGVALSFVVAHELGHLIFQHSPKDLKNSRKNEDEADDFAIRVNWMIGNNPLLALSYFQIFAQVEGLVPNAGRTHTASGGRLEKFMFAGIKFTESDDVGKQLLRNDSNFSIYFKQIKETHARLKKMVESGGAMPETGTPILR